MKRSTEPHEELSREGRPSDKDRYRDQTEMPNPRERLLELILTEAEQRPRIEGVVIGILKGFAKTGVPLVDFLPNQTGEPLPARATVVLEEAHVGRDVALLFEQGDPRKPIVMGLMWIPADIPAGSTNEDVVPKKHVTVSADGERVTLAAEREIVLRCGEASITLTRAGKVLIRGKYLLSRSSGVNRIKGGSVQIN